MYEDLKRYIEIKINWSKRPANSKAVPDKRTVMNGGLDPMGGVDISRNFNVRDCFHTQPIMKIMENYIFKQVIPNMNKFFELRMRMNDKHTTLVRNTMRLIAESSKHVGKDN